MDGLTEGGKRLLDSILSKGSNCTIDQNVISQCLDANGMLPDTWHPDFFVCGVHLADHKQGVTLDDYKYIKAHLMIIGRWE